METMPYKIIESIKKELLDNNFLNLPDCPTEDDLSPYRDRMLNYKASLITEFVFLFGTLLGSEAAVKFIDDIIDVEDMSAQGVTKWVLSFNLLIDNKSFKLKIRCLIFQSAIQCFLLPEKNGVIEIVQKEGLAKGIRMLLDNISTDTPVPLRTLI